MLLTGPLGGAPGQRAGDVALLVPQQSQTQAWTVCDPEQNLTSVPCSGRAPQGVVHVNIHRSARQCLAGHQVPHQDLQGKLGRWGENGRKFEAFYVFICGSTCGPACVLSVCRPASTTAPQQYSVTFLSPWKSDEAGTAESMGEWKIHQNQVPR